MYHSITFGDKNCYSDWFLIPDGRPVVAPPKPKTQFEEIPGASGSLDLSESLTGFITYEDRTGSWEFYVENDHGTWIGRYSEIMRYLHGKRMKVTLEDDPDYYYIGRLEVNDWKSDPGFSKITIDYTLDPFKYSHHVFEHKFELRGDYASIVLHDVEQVTIPTLHSTRGYTIDDEGMPAGYARVNYRGINYDIPYGTETAKFAVWPDEDREVRFYIGYHNYDETSDHGTLTVKYRRIRL